ncbi:MAG: YceI family protein, partial [Flexibacteraceae bacterium]
QKTVTMRKKLLPLLLLFVLVSSAAMAQASYALQVGGRCNRATLSMLTNTGSVDYNSDAVDVNIDLGTHYFGFACKLATFKAANASENAALDQIFNLRYNLVEFTPDNPAANIRELTKGQSVTLQIPGLLKISGVRSPITLPITFSRDNRGVYHFTTDFTVNVNTFGNSVPADLQNTYNGSFRIQLAY